MTAPKIKAQAETLLRAHGLSLVTPKGRTLIEGLNLSLARQKVAMMGRNGVGKSTLLKVLAGRVEPTRGSVSCPCACHHAQQDLSEAFQGLVGQLTQQSARAVGRARPIDDELACLKLPALFSLQSATGLSRGELRKLSLVRALHSGAELLLLDEPTQDLDASGRAWLQQRLREWQGGLLVVSHDESLLSDFDHFFVVAESGCRYFRGSFSQLQQAMEVTRRAGDKKYIRSLQRLTRKEEHNALVARRRERKKMVGRVREIDRAPSRALLNSKRSYAQESQGKRETLQAARIDAARTWTRATCRALSVQLSLAPTLPQLPPDDGEANLSLEEVTIGRADRILCEGLSLRVQRERIAITGPNGAGKTSLLELMGGRLVPGAGRVRRLGARIASISQGADRWKREESLIATLLLTSRELTPDALAERLVSHKFPLALAARPMRSLSPGERLRAALLCIFEQETAAELLLLDEPTYSLDCAGETALRELLGSYTGGLVVASHDRSFLRAIGIRQEIDLGSPGTNTRGTLVVPFAERSVLMG